MSNLLLVVNGLLLSLPSGETSSVIDELGQVIVPFIDFRLRIDNYPVLDEEIHGCLFPFITGLVLCHTGHDLHFRFELGKNGNAFIFQRFDRRQELIHILDTDDGLSTRKNLCIGLVLGSFASRMIILEPVLMEPITREFRPNLFYQPVELVNLIVFYMKVQYLILDFIVAESLFFDDVICNFKH